MPCLQKRSFIAPVRLSLFLLIFLTGCGSDGGGNSATDAAGAADVAIQWHQTRFSNLNSAENYAIKAISDCNTEGVANVQCEAFEEEDLLLTQSDNWPCSDGSGTIDGIASGKNRTIVCLGRTNEEIVHLGRILGVTINPDETTNAGVVDSYPFVTGLVTPLDEDTIVANRVPLVWESVPNADYYYVQVAENEQFDPLFIDEPESSGTSFTPDSLMPNTTYFWQIAPGDRYGHYGRFGQYRQFRTADGPVCRRPVIEEIPSQSVQPGETVHFTAVVNDLDVDEGLDDELTFNNDLPDGAVFDGATGEFTWVTTASDAGNHNAVFRVCDSCPTEPLCVTEEVSINVGNVPCVAPNLQAIGTPTVQVGDPIRFTLNVTNAAECTRLTYAADGRPSGAAFDTATGTFDWTPQAQGTYPMTFTAVNHCSDAVSTPASISVTINVTAPVCEEPILNAITNPTNNVYGNELVIRPGISNPNPNFPVSFETTIDGQVAGASVGENGVLTFNRDPARYRVGDRVDFSVNIRANRVCPDGPLYDEETIAIHARHPCVIPQLEIPQSSFNINVGDDIQFAARVVESNQPSRDLDIGIRLGPGNTDPFPTDISSCFNRETLTFSWHATSSGSWIIFIETLDTCDDPYDSNSWERLTDQISFTITVADPIVR